MPLNTAGKIQYTEAAVAGGVRFQADPPVCSVCEQEITRKNFGFAGVENKRRTPETFEFIECTACTPMRQSGDALKLFLKRHNL
jgi:hypothetical protein